jgi:hypothetical protein
MLSTTSECVDGDPRTVPRFEHFTAITTKEIIRNPENEQCLSSLVFSAAVTGHDLTHSGVPPSANGLFCNKPDRVSPESPGAKAACSGLKMAEKGRQKARTQ